MFEHGKDGYLSDWANNLVAKGREEGRVEGRGEGLVEGLITAVLDLIVDRQLASAADVESRLRGATEPQLRRWLLRASRASTIDEVFDDG